MKLKRRYLYTCALLLSILLSREGFANSIGGSARIAGKGFAQVTGDLGLRANPASFNYSKGSLVMSRSELFDIGVFYNYYEGTVRLSHRLRLGFCYESLIDKDLVDYSGFGQQMYALGAAYKVNENLKLGANLTKDLYNLFEDNVGEGFSCDLGILVGPYEFNSSNIELGFKIENLLAHKDYKTGRVENIEPKVTFGSSIEIGRINCSIDVKSEELYFGAEYQAISSLALRAGLANGQPTFGIGVLRGGLQIDYAYWLSDVEATHRVGSSISF